MLNRICAAALAISFAAVIWECHKQRLHSTGGGYAVAEEPNCTSELTVLEALKGLNAALDNEGNPSPYRTLNECARAAIAEAERAVPGESTGHTAADKAMRWLGGNWFVPIVTALTLEAIARSPTPPCPATPWPDRPLEEPSPAPHQPDALHHEGRDYHLQYPDIEPPGH